MARVSAEQWTFAALRALGRGGPKAVRVEPLAKDLGVTKGSFYHHFKNRRALLNAAFAQWHRSATLQIIEAVDAGSQEPAGRLDALLHLAFGTTVDQEQVEAAIRAWAAQDGEVSAQLAQVDQQRLDYVVELLLVHGLPRSQAQDRAQLLYRCMIGDSVWRRQGGAALAPSGLQELLRLTLSPPASSA